eukprot:TRINITY_DN6121_c0_g1_i1.p1 TRINITY_DN6121_c0_g1~~TRINITY_DN6121_c0_g1_i1.p1  ORF type:complete len:859 (+),score=172.13 TRINITY_DN6121_c0_g1_i1:34-2577(+)
MQPTLLASPPQRLPRHGDQFHGRSCVLCKGATVLVATAAAQQLWRRHYRLQQPSWKIRARTRSESKGVFEGTVYVLRSFADKVRRKLKRRRNDRKQKQNDTDASEIVELAAQELQSLRDELEAERRMREMLGRQVLSTQGSYGVLSDALEEEQTKSYILHERLEDMQAELEAARSIQDGLDQQVAKAKPGLQQVLKHLILRSEVLVNELKAAKFREASLTILLQQAKLKEANVSPAWVRDAKLEFDPGQQVRILQPHSMAGKQGMIVGPSWIEGSLLVQLGSGSILHVETTSLQDASAPPPVARAREVSPAAVASASFARPEQDQEELKFNPGQKVKIIRPHAMTGQVGTIIKPALGNAFAVKFDSGSVFNIETPCLQDAVASAPAEADDSPAEPAPTEPAKHEEGPVLPPGQRVRILEPHAMAGKQGVVVGPSVFEASLVVELDSGSVFNIPVSNMQDAADDTATSTVAPDSGKKLQDGTQLEFAIGQKVKLLHPHAMAGKQGTIVGPAPGESYAVQLSSGSIFHIATASMQDAATFAPATPESVEIAQDEEASLFESGQRVRILNPHAMGGKQGVIVKPASGGAYAVQFDSGSIFNIATASIHTAVSAADAASASTAASESAAGSASERESARPAKCVERLVFTSGQRVRLLHPHAMAGKQGTIVGPAPGEAFAVEFDSGSVFHIAITSLQDAAALAPEPTAETLAELEQGEGELEFSPGQRIRIHGSHVMTGKQGTIRGPSVFAGSFLVKLDSGGVRNIAIANLQDAAPPAILPATSPAASDHASRGLFEKGQRVEILGPPALAGKQGTIFREASDGCWRVMLTSGSRFNIEARNLTVLVEEPA